MGYRSQVCIALTNHACRLLKTIEHHLPDDHEVRELLGHARGTYPHKLRLAQMVPDHDYYIKLYWEAVKWYDGYPCVDFIENFLEGIPPEDYRFIRVGEDSGDEDERGEFWDAEIYVHRTIEW